MVTVGFSMVALGFTLLLVSILYPAKPARVGACGDAVAALGRKSYAFYLWHGPVILWLEQLIPPRPLTAVITSFVASCVLRYSPHDISKRRYFRSGTGGSRLQRE